MAVQERSVTKARVLCELRESPRPKWERPRYEVIVVGAEGLQIEDGHLILLDADECVVAMFHKDVWCGVTFEGNTK